MNLLKYQYQNVLFVMQHKVYFLQIVMWMKSMGLLKLISAGFATAIFMLIYNDMWLNGEQNEGEEEEEEREVGKNTTNLTFFCTDIQIKLWDIIIISV